MSRTTQTHPVPARVPEEEDRIAARQRPDQTPVMYQSWRDLLFVHWKYDPAEIQKTLPEGLHVDTFGGDAYIGVTPFFVQGARPPLLPALPFVSDFLEVNFRTYVYADDGTPGVWFYSLQASQPLAVQAARVFYRLPYRTAEIQAQRDDATNAIHYRLGSGNCESRFHYRLNGRMQEAAPRSLEFFLIERYVLFAAEAESLFQARVHHPPYLLCRAEVTELSLYAQDEFTPPAGAPDHLIASPGVDVEVFAPHPCG